MPSPASCPECGAALSPGATVCDLCGLPVEGADAPPGESLDDAVRVQPESNKQGRIGIVPVESVPVEDRTATTEACPTCGHDNPPQARFCNQCGTALQAAVSTPDGPGAAAVPHDAAVPAVEPAAQDVRPVESVPPIEQTTERPPSDPGQQAFKLVGIAILAVLGLYLITQWSQRNAAAPAALEQPTASATAPTPATGLALPDSVENQIAEWEDEGTAASFASAGRLLFQRAMASTDEGTVAALSQRAVDAFEQSLAQTEDLDVRTNLAAAALYDPRAPMRAVQELQQVLSVDPDHVEGNFNMGLLRMRIGRLDAAEESFQKVLSGSEPSSQVYQEAERALASVRDARASGAAGGENG